MNQLLGIVGVAIGSLFIIVLASLFSTFLWYCFDDKLAEVTGVPALGNIPWFNVWPFTLFISNLFKASVSRGSKND